jgi:serine acetyltransferase
VAEPNVVDGLKDFLVSKLDCRSVVKVFSYDNYLESRAAPSVMKLMIHSLGYRILIWYRLAQIMEYRAILQERKPGGKKFFGRLAIFWYRTIEMLLLNSITKTYACDMSVYSIIGPEVRGTFRNFGLTAGVQIGRHVTIDANVTVASACKIGDGVKLHTGCTIYGDNISIENRAVVAAGAVVLRSVKEGALCIGNPARIISRR